MVQRNLARQRPDSNVPSVDLLQIRTFSPPLARSSGIGLRNTTTKTPQPHTIHPWQANRQRAVCDQGRPHVSTRCLDSRVLGHFQTAVAACNSSSSTRPSPTQQYGPAERQHCAGHVHQRAPAQQQPRHHRPARQHHDVDVLALVQPAGRGGDGSETHVGTGGDWAMREQLLLRWPGGHGSCTARRQPGPAQPLPRAADCRCTYPTTPSEPAFALARATSRGFSLRM